MRDQRTLLRRVDVGLAVGGLGALVFAATRLPTAGSWGWGAVAMLGTALVFAVPVAVVIGRRDHRMVLDTPVLVPAVLLLPGATVVLATMLGVCLGTAQRLLREGRPVWPGTLRTAATFTAAVAAQALVAEQLAPTGAQWLLAVALLEVVHLLVVLPVPVLRARANLQHDTGHQWRQLVPSLVVAPLAAGTAGGIVLLFQAFGGLGLAGYAPVAMMLALGHFLTTTQQDRRRLNALYALALDTTEAADSEEAYTAAVTAAAHVIPGARVRVGDAALDDSSGYSVELAPGSWLVAARPSDALSHDDHDLLAAVGRLARTSAQRATLRRELQRQERIKTALLAAAGHDLQTPLAVQKGVADTLLLHRDKLDEDQVADLISRVAANAGRMSRTIAGLVDLERLELSDGPLVVCHADHVVTTWADEVDLPNGRFLALDVETDRPTPVALSRTYLERVVENLVANAARYSPREEPITIRVERHEQEVLLAVEDRGSGVPQHDRERIFAALEQGDSGVRGSVGLGLFIVSRLVEHGGGRITVEDRSGGGASFRVWLPVVAAGGADAGAPGTAQADDARV